MISVLVGRHPNCGIVIDDPTVSRHHATIVEAEPGTFLIKDENSSCGTFIFQSSQWKRIATVRVSDTDRIRLGAFETTIESLLRTKPALRKTTRTVERNPETGEIIVRTS